MAEPGAGPVCSLVAVILSSHGMAWADPCPVKVYAADQPGWLGWDGVCLSC